MTHSLKKKVAFIGLLFIVFIQAYLNQTVSRMDLLWLEPPAERQQRFDPLLYQTLTFGYLPTGIDWILIQCLVDTTMNQVLPGKHSLFYYQLELLTDLDPGFFDAYYLGGTLLAVIQHDGQGAKNLLLKAENFFKNQLSSYPEKFRFQYWSHPWTLNILQAYVHLFLLGEMHEAASYFSKAAQYSDAPVYLSRLVKKFLKVGGEYEVALNLVEFLARATKDPRVVDEHRHKYQELLKAKYLFDFNQSFLDFRIRQKARAHKIDNNRNDDWKNFLNSKHLTGLDPWKGQLSLGQDGKIQTTTHHEAVFGLE